MHPLTRTLTAAALITCSTLLTLAAMPQTSTTPLSPPAPASGPQIIRPAALWPDNTGQHIQAHGGGILQLKPGEPGAIGPGITYYWFGEQRGQNLAQGQRAVSCYVSKDLIRWTRRNDVLTLNTADFPGGLILERPKVFYNRSTKKFVMYIHLDNNGYRQAEVGVATSDNVDGHYTLIKHFRPLNHESRDIGQFVDDDGTAYLIFEDRPNGWHIAKLSDDYLSVEKDICLIKMAMEGGALVHYNGLYYAIGSHLTGWNANPNLYATAKSLEGPWSEFKDIAPPARNTYGAQSTMLVKVVGSQSTTIIYLGDIWRPQTQWDSRYLWMPLEIGDGKLWLPEPREWTLDITTGQALINQTAPAMTLPAPATGGAVAEAEAVPPPPHQPPPLPPADRASGNPTF